jgi:hypothetical protein
VEGKGWIPAAKLTLGDKVLGHQGAMASIESLSLDEAVDTVYNLRVSDHHTYFVGSDAWRFSLWVHNTKIPGAPSPFPPGNFRCPGGYQF